MTLTATHQRLCSADLSTVTLLLRSDRPNSNNKFFFCFRLSVCPSSLHRFTVTRLPRTPLTLAVASLLHTVFLLMNLTDLQTTIIDRRVNRYSTLSPEGPNDRTEQLLFQTFLLLAGFRYLQKLFKPSSLAFRLLPFMKSMTTSHHLHATGSALS